jgi:hypothetical protein
MKSPANTRARDFSVSHNLPVTLHRRRSALQFSRAEEKKLFDPAEGLAS